MILTTSQGQLDNDMGRLIYFLFNRIAKTEEFRNASFSFILEVIQLWAGNSTVKKRVSKSVKKSLKKGLIGKKAPVEADQLFGLFDDPVFLKLFGKFLPRFFNNMSNIAASLASGIEKLPIEDKEQLFSRPISKTDMGRTGEFLTSVFRTVNEIHRQTPVFYADKTHVAFKNLIESIDFGELKEAVDNSSDDIAAAIRACNEELWKYPAKVVSCFAVLPSLLKIFTNTMEHTLGRFNDISPDLLTDIILSLMRQVDVRSIGALVNQVAELARKLHTGSALLGEAGNPKFPRDFSQVAGDFFDALDPELFYRAQLLMDEGKSSVENSLLDIFRDNLNLVSLRLANLSIQYNHRLRIANRKLSLVEELPEEEMIGALEQGLSELDVQEIAEIVNFIGTLSNKIGSLKPELLPSLAEQLVNSLDLDEIKNAAESLCGGVGQSLKPVGRAVLPGLVKSFCDCFAPSDDEYEDEVAEARVALKNLILGAEVRP